MKKIYIIFILILASLLVSFDLKNYKNLRILAAKSPSNLVVDFNKNNQIDDDETADVYGIKDFEYSDNKTQNAQNLYINYLFKKWATENLNYKFAVISKKNSKYDVMLGSKNYAELVLKESFAKPTEKDYNKYFSEKNLNTKIESIYKNNLVLVNKTNKKYHKLSCKYAILAHNFDIIPLNTALEYNFKPCRYCHHHDKHSYNQINIAEIAPPPYYKNFGDITVFFIDSSNTRKPDNSCSGIACKTLLKEINSAKKSIDIAIYGIEDQPKLSNAIVNAQKRNVKIRLVSDVESNGSSYYKDNYCLISKIQNSITDANSFPKYIMHNKFLIFDDSKVWTGSSNLTSTDFSNFNTNYNVLIHNAEVIKAYKTEFEELYSDKFHTNKKLKHEATATLSAYFSPQDEIITQKMIPLIDKSKTYVYIPIFYLTHKQLTNSLIQAKKRGVDVKIIIDATNAHAHYTVHKILRSANIPVKTENKAGKMHAKVIIIDDKYSIIGSMNFTKSGEKYNDENMVIIENPEIAKYLKSTFIYLWNSIPDKYLKIDPYAESKTSIGSCTDGIDNDFDNKIDSDDDFCK